MGVSAIGPQLSLEVDLFQVLSGTGQESGTSWPAARFNLLVPLVFDFLRVPAAA